MGKCDLKAWPTTIGTTAGIGENSIVSSVPAEISLISAQLGEIIKAAVTQSMQQYQKFLVSSKPQKKVVTNLYEGNIDGDDK